MEDPKITKSKILNVLRLKGPCVPIQISKEAGISSLFAGAFLSELYGEKKINISSMKVGGSPLYYLPEQEKMLDNFFNFLPGKEKEAFLLLKDNKILSDKDQHPAIRVALRLIKDFAVSFKKDEEIFWRFHSITEQEVRDLLEPKPEEKKEITETKKEPEELKEKILEKNPEKEEVKVERESTIKEIEVPKPRIQVKKDKQLDIGLKGEKREEKEKPKKNQEASEKFENPLIIPEEPKKEKPKSAFVLGLIERISKRYQIIEEKYYKPKEYSCVVQINSDLGPINFLVFATDKKKLSETDLKKMLSDAQKIPLPALVLHEGELSKKAVEYSKVYFSILKVEKL